MATKFKVGDKVRVINSNSYNGCVAPKLSVGEIITLRYYTDCVRYGWWSIYENSNFYRYVQDENIELVEEECEPCKRPNMFIFDEMSEYDWNKKSNYLSRIYGDWIVSNFKSDNKKTIMSKITTFAKNLVLSADEKLLRKYGLKDECGEFTNEAESLVMAKLVKENEAYLVELATAMQAEEAKK